MFKMDKTYGRKKIELFINHSKNIKYLFERGVYSYQECLESKASMFKCKNRKKKKNEPK